MSGCDGLGNAGVEVDFSKPSKRELALAPVLPVIRAAGQVRSPGCAVVGLCAVAAGKAEAHIDAGLGPWDCAAGMLLVEEAGGRVTRVDGAPLDLLDGRQGLLASNGLLHEALLAAVKQ